MSDLIERLRDLKSNMQFFSAARILCGEAADRIEALEAENTLLRKDAARYHYLRNRDPGPEGKPLPRGLFIGMVPRNLILTEEHADVAIDAAIKAMGGGDE